MEKKIKRKNNKISFNLKNILKKVALLKIFSLENSQALVLTNKIKKLLLKKVLKLNLKLNLNKNNL